MKTFKNEIQFLSKEDLIELKNLLKLTLDKTWEVYHNTDVNNITQLDIEMNIIETIKAKIEIVEELIKDKDLIKVKAFNKDNSYQIIDTYNPIQVSVIANKFERFEYLNH